MVKIKLQISQHLRDYYPILGRHVHPQQQDGRHKIHSHYLGQDQHYYVRALTRRHPVEELGQCEQQTSDRRHHDAADQVKADLLRPETNVYVQTHPVDGDFDASCNRVLFADPVEDYVYGALE